MNTVDSCDTLLAKADLLMYAHKRRHAAPIPPKGLRAVLQGEEDLDKEEADTIIGGLTSLRILDYMQDPNARPPKYTGST